MGPLVPVLGAIGTVASIAGTGLSLLGQKKAGDEAAQRAEIEAQLAHRQAEDTAAIGQRAAAERAHKARLLQSKFIAQTASGGGIGSSSTLLKLWSEIEQEGEYQTASIIGDADRVASGLNYQGVLDRSAGRQAQIASRWNMGSTLLGGVQSFAGKYGDPDYNDSFTKYLVG